MDKIVGRLVDLVKTSTGIERESLHMPDVHAVLQRMPGRSRFSADADYISWLEQLPGSHPEFRELISTVTINETSFFRHASQLRALAEEAAAKADARGGPVRIWSAACSTGEEVYSIGLLLRRSGVQAEILGTDIDSVVIRQASAGAGYSNRSINKVPADIHRCFFQEERPGRWRLNPGMLDGIRFEVSNLMDEVLPRPRSGSMWDFILCRNVFIYFSRETTDEVIERMVSALAPDGSLWLGAADPVLHSRAPIRATQTPSGVTYYVRSKGILPATNSSVGPPDADGRDSLQAALMYISREQYESAICALNDHLQDRPADTTAYLALGHIMMQRGDTSAAEANYARALALNAECGEAAYFWALVQYRTDRVPDVLSRLVSLASSEDLPWPCRILLALSYERGGRMLEAELEWSRAREALHQNRHLSFESPHELVNGVHTYPSRAQTLVDQRLEQVAASRDLHLDMARTADLLLGISEINP